MNFFSRVKEFIFGRQIDIEHHDLQSFPFDVLGSKEAKQFFYKSGSVLCTRDESILEKFKQAPEKSYDYLDTLFKMSWAKHWAQVASKEMKVATSDHFILMSYDEQNRNELLLKYAEKSLDRIYECLDGILLDSYGKTLIFHVNADDYYALEESFERPESDEGVSSGGMFVRGVVPYMIFHSEPGFNLPDITLVHELTHALLTHNDLPMWLDEALACTMEKTITGECCYDWSLENGLKNIDYWDFETIQKFWVGEAFKISESQEFSYLLAQGLFNVIVKDYKQEFKTFIRNAKREDAGEASAQKYLGVSLGEIANRYLGKGPWAPSYNYLNLYFQ